MEKRAISCPQLKNIRSSRRAPTMPDAALATGEATPIARKRGRVAAALLAIAAGIGTTSQAAPADRAPLCPRLLPSTTIAFAGLYPAIEKMLPLSNFQPGQVVEIDPRVVIAAEAKAYIRSLQALGARVSIYLVGGHCGLDGDCDALPRSVRIGSTGSWYWNESERRILSITHPAVLARLAKGIQQAWELGANFVRIDNLHHPAGSTHPRTPAQMRTIIDLALDIEDRLRARGSIEPDRVTGLVAHNNLVSWERLIEQGQLRRPPAFLTSERTAQLAALPDYQGDIRMKAGQLAPGDVPDIEAGRRLAQHFQIPYSIVEFRKSHDLSRRGQTYALPQTYVEALRRLRGVTEVIVIRDESRYVGRDEVFPGAGPRSLPQNPDLAARPLGGQACSLLPVSE
jgi:hypothetical protein